MQVLTVNLAALAKDVQGPREPQYEWYFCCSLSFCLLFHPMLLEFGLPRSLRGHFFQLSLNTQNPRIREVIDKMSLASYYSVYHDFLLAKQRGRKSHYEWILPSFNKKQFICTTPLLSTVSHLFYLIAIVDGGLLHPLSPLWQNVTMRF